MRTAAPAAAGSNSWVQVKTHRTIGDAVAHLKGQGMDSGNPSSDNAVDFREIHFPPDLYFDGIGETASRRKRWSWRIRISSFR